MTPKFSMSSWAGSCTHGKYNIIKDIIGTIFEIGLWIIGKSNIWNMHMKYSSAEVHIIVVRGKGVCMQLTLNGWEKNMQKYTYKHMYM